MNMKRNNAAGAMFEGDDDNWWITGGSDGDNVLNSSEIFNVMDNTFSMGIEIPLPLNHHNLVNVNNTHMVLLGYYPDQIYIFDR